MTSRVHAGDSHRDWPPDGLVALEDAHLDERGGIQPLVDAAFGSAVLIGSNDGVTRGNHYHRTDWHYCYVVSGCMEYFFRPQGSSGAPQRLLVPQGAMVFTSPLVEHAMRFIGDTVFVALARNRRDQASYEGDVVRVELIGE